MSKDDQKKARERGLLEDAQRIGSIIPCGTVIESERPDFRIHSDGTVIGVEVTELLRRGANETPPPVEKSSFHRRVVERAKELHVGNGGVSVSVGCYFLNDSRAAMERPNEWAQLVNANPKNKRELMASSLKEFVRTRDYGCFTERRELPAGFEVITINPSDTHDWSLAGDSANQTLSEDVFGHIQERIDDKAEKLPLYRTNCNGSPVWLLIASSMEVARSVPIPRSLADWKFRFEFDKVLLYSATDGRVWDLSRD